MENTEPKSFQVKTSEPGMFIMITAKNIVTILNKLDINITEEDAEKFMDSSENRLKTSLDLLCDMAIQYSYLREHGMNPEEKMDPYLKKLEMERGS